MSFVASPNLVFRTHQTQLPSAPLARNRPRVKARPQRRTRFAPSRPTIMGTNINEQNEWEARWSAGIERGAYFDAIECHPKLKLLIKQGTFKQNPTAGPSGSALVPGCGRGYEVLELAASDNFESVTGLDISMTGVKAAQSHANEVNADKRANFVHMDFFQSPQLNGQFRLVVDYTFLCAINPSMRKQWAQRMADVLQPQGLLVTFMFPLLKPVEMGGPPHGLSIALYHELLEPVGFEVIEGPSVLPEDEAHKRRANGNSAYGIWRKK